MSTRALGWKLRAAMSCCWEGDDQSLTRGGGDHEYTQYYRGRMFMYIFPKSSNFSTFLSEYFLFDDVCTNQILCQSLFGTNTVVDYKFNFSINAILMQFLSSIWIQFDCRLDIQFWNNWISWYNGQRIWLTNWWSSVFILVQAVFFFSSFLITTEPKFKYFLKTMQLSLWKSNVKMNP